MTVRWEKFAGRTDVFAIRLSFSPDPDEGIAINPEEAASWGRLQLWVKGQNLCAHVDQGELLEGVHWYMLPFLEWLTEAWNPLLHEERLPNRNVGDTAVESLMLTRNAPALAAEVDISTWEQEWYEWGRHHALRAARSGGLFPNIVFRRLHDYIEISWDDEPTAGTPSGFRFSLGQGSALLDPEDVANPLYELTADAIRYLEELMPKSERLAALKVRLQDLGKPYQRENRLRWLVGLPAHALTVERFKGVSDGQFKASWERVLNILRHSRPRQAGEAALATEETSLVVVGSCQAALLFGSVAPTISEADVYTLAEVLLKQYSRADRNQELEKLSRSIPPDEGALIWEQGYDLAESLHDVLDLTGEWVDVRSVIRNLGIHELRRKLDDANIRGCSIVGPEHKPTVVINKSSSYSTSAAAVRFTLAHELCHILYDRSHGKRLAMASGPWAPRSIEKRANAFAAMFLMPPYLIERAIADSPDPITELEGARTVARKLRVSTFAAIEHLYSLTLMTEIERDKLLACLEPVQRAGSR
jgi:Zn-dependent peptidase ImmA (M78 family)